MKKFYLRLLLFLVLFSASALVMALGEKYRPDNCPDVCTAVCNQLDGPQYSLLRNPFIPKMRMEKIRFRNYYSYNRYSCECYWGLPVLESCNSYDFMGNLVTF